MNKTVLITGASSGIGAATARLFGDQGWNVVATLRVPDGAPRPANVLVARLDVQDRTSIERALEAGLARFGRIDVLVNNAGVGRYGAFESISLDQVRDQFEVNVFGVMEVTRALLPHFRGNRGGLIVNVSSGLGSFALPLTSIYSASKFALEGLSESLAVELASQRIDVKLVVPQGRVAGTRFHEKAEPAEPGDPALSDYDAFVRRTRDSLAHAPGTIAADEVARVNHTAATDGTHRFRYPVGAETAFLKAKRTMATEDYIDFLRSRFPP